MENFLKQIKLIEDFNITLPISKQNFVDNLSKVTTANSSLIESLGNNNKQFVGEVNFDSFSIRPMRKLGQNNLQYITKLSADFKSNTQTTTIEGRIHLSKLYPIIIAVISILYFAIGITALSNMEGSFPLIPLAIQFLFMLGVFYFVFRRAIKNAKGYFEKELFFLTKDNSVRADL